MYNAAGASFYSVDEPALSTANAYLLTRCRRPLINSPKNALTTFPVATRTT